VLSALSRIWRGTVERRLARRPAAALGGGGVLAPRAPGLERAAPRVSGLSWAARIALVAVGLHALVWIFLPASTVHPDSLDELQSIEEGRHAPISKHPADMPLLGLMWSGLQALGYAGRAIRPVQIWNGAWMTLAFAGVLFFARRSQGRWTAVGAGFAALLAGMLASLHLAVDPHNTYYPPGLALMTWGLALSLRGHDAHAGAARREWWGALACLLAAVLFNPMVAVVCPLAALAWFARARSARLPTRTALVRGLVPLAAPLAVMLAFLEVLSVERVVSGPYGTWSPITAELSWNAAREAFLGHRASYVPALAGERTVIALLVTAASMGLALAGCASVALVSLSRSAVTRFLPYGLAALLVGLFVAWWGPGNFVFWVLPVWLAALGLIHATDGTALAARRVGSVVLAAAVLLWTVNGRSVWLEARGPNRQERRALRIERNVRPEDTVVHLGWQSPALSYYTDVRCRGVLGLHCFRADGASTLEMLQGVLRSTRQRGGALYLETPRPGRPWVTPALRELLRERDYDDADFERMRFGRSFTVDGTVFREVLALNLARR
jgi:hypothetical protein